jgi:hypothetical protein
MYPLHKISIPSSDGPAKSEQATGETSATNNMSCHLRISKDGKLFFPAGQKQPIGVKGPNNIIVARRVVLSKNSKGKTTSGQQIFALSPVKPSTNGDLIINETAKAGETGTEVNAVETKSDQMPIHIAKPIVLHPISSSKFIPKLISFPPGVKLVPSTNNLNVPPSTENPSTSQITETPITPQISEKPSTSVTMEPPQIIEKTNVSQLSETLDKPQITETSNVSKIPEKPSASESLSTPEIVEKPINSQTLEEPSTFKTQIVPHMTEKMVDSQMSATLNGPQSTPHITQPQIPPKLSQPPIASELPQPSIALTSSQPSIASKLSQPIIAPKMSQPTIAHTPFQSPLAPKRSQISVAPKQFQIPVAFKLSQSPVASKLLQPPVSHTLHEPVSLLSTPKKFDQSMFQSKEAIAPSTDTNVIAEALKEKTEPIAKNYAPIENTAHPDIEVLSTKIRPFAKPGWPLAGKPMMKTFRSLVNKKNRQSVILRQKRKDGSPSEPARPQLKLDLESNLIAPKFVINREIMKARINAAKSRNLANATDNSKQTVIPSTSTATPSSSEKP